MVGDPAALFLPAPGAQSAPVDAALSWESYAAAGFRPAGPRAVRLDALERLAGACNAARGQGRDFALDPALAQTIGSPARDLEGVLAALGYRRTQESGPATPARWRPPAPSRARPSPRGGAPRGNAFGALADLMPPRKASGS
jgi:ATP-dependent RNA helicase SUPV3L1/SUV3